MYDVEKRSAVLEDAAGFARLDAHMYGPVTKLGVCLYIGETNFAFAQTLYESKCRQR